MSIVESATIHLRCQAMRIAELKDRTGVAIPTLKFYLREGLLPSGDATAVNQAEYSENHVRRVRLIRSLVEIARLSLSDVRSVLDAVDDDRVSMHDAFATAQDAMVPRRERNSERHEAALAEVDTFVRRHRLRVRPDAAVRDMLADALSLLGQFGIGDEHQRVDSRVFDRSFSAILEQAAFEIANVPDASRAEQVEYTVVGTIASEIAAAAMRRMALEHESAKRFQHAPTRGAKSRRRA